jgi:hypothetical protein
MSAGSICTDGNATCLASFVAKQVWNGSKRPLSCASRIGLPPDAFGNALPEFTRQLSQPHALRGITGERLGDLRDQESISCQLGGTPRRLGGMRRLRRGY